ncbi:hypothetical protein MMC14_004230 [Varicellaria rhodocarpa]|nr:hypothetical protein [Varicellaria rhodocarpa]
MTAGETTVPLGMRSTLLSAYKSWISGLEEYDYVTQIVSHFFPTAYPTNVPLALTSLYNAWTSAGSTPWDFYTDVQSFVQSVTAVEGDLSEGLIGKAAFSTLLWYSAGAEQTMTGLTSVWEEESSSEAAAGAAFSSQFFRTHTPKIIPTTATTTGLSASNTLVFWETPSLVPSPTPPGPEPSYTGDPFLTDASSPAAGRTLQNRPFAWIFSVVAMAMLALWISPVAAIYQVAGIAFVELYVVFIVMGRV